MKKFRFKLETLLGVTRRKKEDAERLFAEATRKLEEERARLVDLLQEMQRVQAEYTEQTREGKRISVGRLMTYTSYVNWKREQIEAQQQAIMQAQAERQKRLKELLALISKLKSIEQLKEKRWQQYKEEVLFEESKQLDEIGLQLYMRKAGA
ncbi:MAG: flagellar export protein FliJ [Schwartzia succinivorans]|jgi:flagellar FliJ protein|nr:flagellar export protein FliJ [Schwartzia succinivorans]